MVWGDPALLELMFWHGKLSRRKILTIDQLMGRGMIRINGCCMCKHLGESGNIFLFIERCLVAYGLS